LATKAFWWCAFLCMAAETDREIWGLDLRRQPATLAIARY
jgi:hypothetical protein